MPIYEFYCSKCHAIYSFFSRSVSVKKLPVCPGCGNRKLAKEVSSFAVTGGGGADEAEDAFDFDEHKMESALDALAGEAGTLNEDDPRAAAGLMRKFSQLSGLKFNDGIEEAIGRLEAGEDPEAIESELGSLLDSEDPFVAGSSRDARKAEENLRRRKAPRRDPNLHDL